MSGDYEVRLRPVHVLKVGRWRINWRVGHYMWGFDYDRLWGAVTIVTPWVYLSWGIVKPRGPRLERPEEEPCQNCGGSGGQYEQTHATYGGQWWEPCPECASPVSDGGEDRP